MMNEIHLLFCDTFSRHNVSVAARSENKRSERPTGSPFWKISVRRGACLQSRVYWSRICLVHGAATLNSCWIVGTRMPYKAKSPTRLRQAWMVQNQVSWGHVADKLIMHICEVLLTLIMRSELTAKAVVDEIYSGADVSSKPLVDFMKRRVLWYLGPQKLIMNGGEVHPCSIQTC